MSDLQQKTAAPDEGATEIPGRGKAKTTADAASYAPEASGGKSADDNAARPTRGCWGVIGNEEFRVVRAGANEAAAIVYACLCTHADFETRKTWVGVPTLAAETGYGERGVRNSLAELRLPPRG